MPHEIVKSDEVTLVLSGLDLSRTPLVEMSLIARAATRKTACVTALWWLTVMAGCLAAMHLFDIWYELHRIEGRLSVDEMPAQIAGSLIVLSLFAIELILLIRNAIRRNAALAFRHLVAILIVGAMVYYGNLSNDYVERARFAAFHSRYASCAASAARSYADKRFKTCDLRTAGDYVRAIVYDTSDEIILPHGKRSSEFENYLELSASPIYVSCRLRSMRLAPHFYFLETGS